jgi:hypothetical protein
MFSVVASVISLVLFFWLVLYLCLRDREQDVNARWDSSIEMMRKSPFGRWRY